MRRAFQKLGTMVKSPTATGKRDRGVKIKSRLRPEHDLASDSALICTARH
jgi:hypothetical protein